jgi:hypothetical protein
MSELTRRSPKQEIWRELQRLREALEEQSQSARLAQEHHQRLERIAADAERQAQLSGERQARLTIQNERLLLLLSLGHELANLSESDALRCLVDRLPFILQVRRVSVYRYDPAAKSLLLEHKNHRQPIDRRVDLARRRRSLMALAVREKRAIILNDVERYRVGERGSTLSFPHRQRYGTPSCLVTPVLNGSEVLGVLNLSDRYDSCPFDQSDREALSQLSQLLAACLHRRRRLEGLALELGVDPLCGCVSRDRFEAELTLARANDTAVSLWVVRLREATWIRHNHGPGALNSALIDVARRLSEAPRVELGPCLLAPATFVLVDRGSGLGDTRRGELEASLAGLSLELSSGLLEAHCTLARAPLPPSSITATEVLDQLIDGDPDPGLPAS